MSLNGFCHTTWINANVSRGFEMTPKSRNAYQSYKNLYVPHNEMKTLLKSNLHFIYGPMISRETNFFQIRIKIKI